VVQVFACHKQELIDPTCALNVREVLILAAQLKLNNVSAIFQKLYRSEDPAKGS
jgi:hypothetical protein